jgi:uncharacterized protein YbjT (DUF2867 family)
MEDFMPNWKKQDRCFEEEKIVEESGIPFTFFRSPAFMQNFITQFGYTIRTQDAFYIPAGDAVFCR